MKPLSFVLLLIASVAFVLMGCSDKSNLPATPNEQVVASSKPPTPLLAKGNPVVNWATGNEALFMGGKIVQSSVSARRYEDGSSDGEYEFWAHYQDPAWSKWHGRVLSLKVWYGNMAVIGGEETGQVGHVDGSYDIFVLIDNGVGSKAAQPDMRCTGIVWVFSLAEAEAMWNKRPEDVFQAIADQWYGGDLSKVLLPVEMGNITVR